MGSSAAKPQTEPLKAAKGRAALRAADRSAAALLRRPQNISELRTDNKNFSSQFDDQRE